ncbi:hypothetical protein GCM10011316_19880 [Roseibium aquae]|uniref:Uncharacterized protein n=2 Tax=Roseibium aquae TaxID=1323746 RepID=A0A916TJ51_9HYPH|nr:hypothetical protein GCM10011316_19880 [Roseibium aquae]
MTKLSKLDIQTTDPAALRLAAVLPDTIHIPAGSARMDLSITNTETGEILLSEQIPLRESGSKAEKAELSGELSDGKQLLIFALADEDLAYFQSFQEHIRAGSGQQRKTHEGTLSLHVTGCAIKDPGPAPIPITTFLKTSELGGFVTLTRNYDLTDALKHADPGSAGRLDKCDGRQIPPA